jgi:uncharacterized protein with PIN domain
MTRSHSPGGALRFQAERPLGKLAKWLRLLGFDTTWEGDPQTATTDEAAGRVLLTRTRRGRRPPPGTRVHFVAANDPFRQLQQLVAALGIQRSDTRPLSRCIRCNQAIVAIGREEVRTRCRIMSGPPMKISTPADPAGEFIGRAPTPGEASTG